jgi:hypothetical protein
MVISQYDQFSEKSWKVNIRGACCIQGAIYGMGLLISGDNT